MTLRQMARRMVGGGVLATLLGMSAGALAEPIKVGYWTSGVSLGFGAVLEAGEFFKKEGIDVTFVRFSDVNAPSRAIAAHAIDVAFAAPAAGVFSTAAAGVPISIIAATQPADVQFVVRGDSPITSLAQLRGKKIGMSPAGSSVAAIAQAVLAGNEHIPADGFSLVPGNESRLAQFLVQKQVDGAALRSVTIAQLGDLKLRPLASFADQWRQLTGAPAVPYIGVAVARNELLAKQPAAVAHLIAGMRAALAWGHAHPDQVAAILQKDANLPAADAQAYARQWDDMNRVALEPADIDTLKREHRIFVDAKILTGTLPAAIFATGPYQAAVRLK
ncbi:ABC transporter substrate-binding protein [Robbsia sp. Bb-Pol-6]|uniref:ABC transporter substrate-binding protein n=1 Tax=Robbsia betulipollinis TaxID=2981849 RepID=A0ABT3ZJP7_9BURK|nr:ABC transporter substrate-binding protein [Robbsia betulipollinis]MCY0386758.1 ABC transporter substrate-binding protein [Robbsia betulipollinis]